MLFTLLLTCFCKSNAENTCSDRYFFPQGYSPDAFEYYLPAANLALHNRFPYYGFISSMEDYRLHPEPDSVKYFRDTQYAGVIVFPSKPPLYSLILGTAFKIFGLNPCVPTGLNKFFVALTALIMLLTGFMSGRFSGMIAASVAAVAMIFLVMASTGDFGAEILTTLLATAAFAVATIAMMKEKKWWYLSAGIVMGLLLLTKGYFVVTAFLFSCYLLFRAMKRKTVEQFVELALFSLGVGLPLLIWMIYINPLLQRGIPERIAFSERLISTAPKVSCESRSDCFYKNGKPRPEVVEAFLKLHQSEYALQNCFVIISNQYGKYNILDMHNEYCSDGDFHPEWRFIKTAFYNQFPEADKHKRLLRFYRQFPEKIFMIAFAKLRNVWGVSAFLLYLSLVITSIFFIADNSNKSFTVGFFFIVGTSLVLVFFYGDIRFVESILPIALFITAKGGLTGFQRSLQ